MRRRFKAGVTGALLVLLAMLCGCTGMVQDELAETHAKLAELQALVDSVNTNLQTLDLIVSKLDTTHTIEPGTLKETEDGYEVSFKDGKKVFIAYGKDGKDGRPLIPIGVLQDTDSLYYWTVDGEWWLDDEGNKMRAGATDGVDGVDGIAPQVKVEDGFWWISHDGGKTFDKLASCEELDGVGVFSGIDTSDPAKIVLKLLDGTALEIPRMTSLKVSFAGQPMDTLLIAAGELLPVPYEVTVEGADAGSVVVTAGTDGIYSSRLVAGSEPGKGTALVQAPAVFSEGYILLSAVCDGYSAVKMISFKERKISPAADTIKVRMASGSDTLSVAYLPNFAFKVSWEGDWLDMAQNTSKDSLIFMSKPNTTDTVRTCTVKVSPTDNPDFVCTTFVVMQATESAVPEVSYDLENADEGFTFDGSDVIKPTLNAPAKGGNAFIWINQRDVTVTKCDTTRIKTTVVPDHVGSTLGISVVANDSETARKDTIEVKIRQVVVNLIINQAGKAAEE